MQDILLKRRIRINNEERSSEGPLSEKKMFLEDSSERDGYSDVGPKRAHSNADISRQSLRIHPGNHPGWRYNLVP